MIFPDLKSVGWLKLTVKQGCKSLGRAGPGRAVQSGPARPKDLQPWFWSFLTIATVSKKKRLIFSQNFQNLLTWFEKNFIDFRLNPQACGILYFTIKV